MTASAHYSSSQKRIFDLILAASLLLIFAPLFLVIAGLIFITVNTPIFFTQERLGKNKKPFTIYKFRTMYLQAEKDQKKFAKLNEAPSPMFKASYDPRFVGIGRFLSKSGLDELPQLINILKGEMSLIGPRPLPVAEARALGSGWDFRYAVLPGVFSFWSLSPDRHDSLESWKQLEKDTLKIESVSQDIQLIFRNLSHHLLYMATSFKRSFTQNLDKFFHP